MKQPRLFPSAPARGKQSKLSQAATHDAENRACAALILANAEAYGGDEALPVMWARGLQAKDQSARPKGSARTN